jgi:outer membrane protein
MSIRFRTIVQAFSFTIASLFGQSAAVASPDLLDVFHDAVLNDAEFQSAYYTRMSVRETLPQAESSLLPQAFGVADVRRQRQVNSESAFAGVPGFSREEFFNPQVYTLDLSQTIFNYQSWMQVQSAKSVVKQAEATFNSAAQDLILRTATAYFNVLDARDNVRFTRAELRATERRLDQARERYKVGLDAVTSVYEAQAEYDAINASLIEAENILANNLEELRVLTGRAYKSVAPLKGEIPLSRPVPDNVERWVDTAVEQNYSLQALKHATDAARDNIKAERAGNFPTLTGNMTHFDTRGANVGGAGFDYRYNTIGLIANFPIIQGGLIASRTRQARYDYDYALAQYEQNYRTVVVGARQTFNTITTGISKVKADKQSIISALNSLDSIEAQYRVGTRTLLDVLDAQRLLFQQQRIFAADQYTYIISTLELKFFAGTLGIEDLQNVNQLVDPVGIDFFDFDDDRVFDNPEEYLIPLPPVDDAPLGIPATPVIENVPRPATFSPLISPTDDSVIEPGGEVEPLPSVTPLAPTDTTPSTPAETTPAETTPAETTPAETTTPAKKESDDVLPDDLDPLFNY